MRKIVIPLLLFAYGLTLFYLTLVLHTTARLPPAGRLNLVVFRTIAIFLRKGGWEMMVNIVGNLGAFVPLGLLWPVWRAGKTTFWRVLLLCAGVSLLIETLQFCSGRRVADVDDLLLNALGGLLGYLVYLALRWSVAARSRMPRSIPSFAAGNAERVRLTIRGPREGLR